MNIAKAILALAALVAVALPSAALSKQQCDDCGIFQKGPQRVIIPANDVVCVYFVQPHRDKALLRLDLKSGKKRHYTKDNADTSDKICVGRHWVRDSASMYLCDTENHATYDATDTGVVSKKARHSRDAEACLFGKVKCKEMGYKTH